jgi:hypothetical protein
VKNGNRNTAPLLVGSPEFYIALGALASEVGRSRFDRNLARLPGQPRRSFTGYALRAILGPISRKRDHVAGGRGSLFRWLLSA